MIHSGTQLYPEGTNEAYFYYNGDMLTHEDIVEIDEATYNGVKQNEINKIQVNRCLKRLRDWKSRIPLY
jgi:hypothetical protein